MIGRFRDPVRLTDDPSAAAKEVGGLIERVRREAPNNKQVAALFSRIEERIAEVPLAETPSHVTRAAGPSKAPLLATTKAAPLVKGGLLLVGGSGAILAAGLWLAASRPVVATNPTSNPTSTATTTTAATATTVASGPAPAERPISARAVPVKILAPKTTLGPRSSVPEDTRHSTARMASGVRPRASEAPMPVRGASPPSRAASDSEAALLRAALEALPSTPRAALRLVDDHARRYPDGVLTQEREVIAIEALVRLGHRESARLRAQELLAKHPSTAHNARIEALLQTSPSAVDAGQQPKPSR